MPSMITLGAARSVHADETGCRCVFNPRTKRHVKVCKVPKSRKHRSGVMFKGNCR